MSIPRGPKTLGSPMPDSSSICGDFTALPGSCSISVTPQGRASCTHPAETMTSPPSLVDTVCCRPSTVNSTPLATNPSPGADKTRETGAFTTTLMFGRDAACLRYAYGGGPRKLASWVTIVNDDTHYRRGTPVGDGVDCRDVHAESDTVPCLLSRTSNLAGAETTGGHTGSAIGLIPRASKVSWRVTSQPGCNFGKESTSGPTRDIMSREPEVVRRGV